MEIKSSHIVGKSPKREVCHTIEVVATIVASTSKVGPCP